jgi:hypothetical protein
MDNHISGTNLKAVPFYSVGKRALKCNPKNLILKRDSFDQWKNVSGELLIG